MGLTIFVFVSVFVGGAFIIFLFHSLCNIIQIQIESKRVPEQNKAKEDLINKYGHLGIVGIINSSEFPKDKKAELLQTIYGFNTLEVNNLIERSRMSAEEVALDKNLSNTDKVFLLTTFHGYSSEEACTLIDLAIKEDERARLKSIKRKISQKAAEMYNDIPVDDRQPISDDVKTFVWQRDKGRCVKCGGNENLEFDHIIPFSKGGSSTGRNLQLLCEKCNREKRDNI